MAYLRTYACDGILDDVACVPAGVTAADAVQEAFVDARALAGVRDLGWNCSA